MELPVRSSDVSRELFGAKILPRGKIMQISISHFLPHQSCPAHKHFDLHEIFVCESGEVNLTVDDHEVHLLPGDVVLVRPGHVHCLVNTSEALCELLILGIACPVE
jgi:quercetin dioxygenase-like cupin family protein